MKTLIFKCEVLASLSLLINCSSIGRVLIPEYDLMLCIEENDRECATRALNRWYAILKPNTTIPLHIAAKKNLIDMADFLIANGADPNGKDNQGTTAVHVAAMYGHIEMLKFLIGKKGDPSIRTKSGANALDLVIGVITVLHFNPTQAVYLRPKAKQERIEYDVESARKLGEEYLACFYFLTDKRLTLAAETVSGLEKIWKSPEAKSNIYTPYFETMYKYLQNNALLKPIDSK